MLRCRRMSRRWVTWRLAARARALAWKLSACGGSDCAAGASRGAEMGASRSHSARAARVHACGSVPRPSTAVTRHSAPPTSRARAHTGLTCHSGRPRAGPARGHRLHQRHQPRHLHGGAHLQPVPPGVPEDQGHGQRHPQARGCAALRMASWAGAGCASRTVRSGRHPL
jgi:hypothetical protein